MHACGAPLPDRRSTSLVILQQKWKGVNCTLLTAARTGLDLFDRNLAETLLNVVSTVQRSSTSRLLEKIKKQKRSRERSQKRVPPETQLCYSVKAEKWSFSHSRQPPVKLIIVYAIWKSTVLFEELLIEERCWKALYIKIQFCSRVGVCLVQC